MVLLTNKNNLKEPGKLLCCIRFDGHVKFEWNDK